MLPFANNISGQPLTCCLLSACFLCIATCISSNQEQAVKTEQPDGKRMAIDYQSLLDNIQENKRTFSRNYENGNDSVQTDILAKSREYVEKMMKDSLIPAWIGTSYAFDGTTDKPREGKIACGYFVSTVLRDAGFRFNRFSLAKQPSGNIIRSVTDELKRFQNGSLSYFMNEVKRMDQGIYILGLDNHVGFIVKDQSELKFCHAAYYAPYEVTCEQLAKASAVANSSYRVLGKVLNKRMVEQWVAMRKIETFR